MKILDRTPSEERLDKENPWPGLASFREENSAFFFGREQEVQQLARLVRRELLCVLFGKSGLGKSSLLKAGLFPLLRQEFYVPIYIRLFHAESTAPLVEQVNEAIHAVIQKEGIDAPLPGAQETLWEYFHRRDVDWWDQKNRLLTPVLVFDQFEEILTLGFEGQTRGDRSQMLLTELEDLVENRIPDQNRVGEDIGHRTASDGEFRKQFTPESVALRIILTLREDFLPDLEELRGRLRPVLLNRFRLLPMTETQARAVITAPSPGLVPDDAVDHILSALSSTKSVFRARRSDSSDREFDPALLSVVCQQLNNRRTEKGEKQITANVVIQAKEEILQDFYEKGFVGLPKEVRCFVEDQLLDESGFRIREALPTALKRPGITEGVIQQLIDRRLVRIEVSLGHEWLELSHDVLANIAKASQALRRNQELLRKARRRAITLVSIGAGLFLLAVGMALLALNYYREGDSLKRANQRLVMNAGGALLTTAANKHQTATVYKLFRELSEMKVDVPQEKIFDTFLPPQRWTAVRMLNLPKIESVHDILFSPDGQYLAALTTDGNLFVSEQVAAEYAVKSRKDDFRQVQLGQEADSQAKCQAIAFSSDNSHSLTIRTTDNQLLLLDCATLRVIGKLRPIEQELAAGPDQDGGTPPIKPELQPAGKEPNAKEPSDQATARVSVADFSIGYYFHRLFIVCRDNTLRIRDSSDTETKVVLPPRLSMTESSHAAHQLRLFESAYTYPSKSVVNLLRDRDLYQILFEDDFRTEKNPELLHSSVASNVDRFAIGPTGLTATFNQANNLLKVTSLLPSERVFNLNLDDIGEIVDDASALAVGRSGDVLICAADGTIRDLLLNPSGEFSACATLKAPSAVTAIDFRRDQAAFVTGSPFGQIILWAKCDPPIGRVADTLLSTPTEDYSWWTLSPSGRLLLVNSEKAIYSYELDRGAGSSPIPKKKQDVRPGDLYYDAEIDDNARVTTITAPGSSTNELWITGDAVVSPIVKTDVDFYGRPALSLGGTLCGYISQDRHLVVCEAQSGNVQRRFRLPASMGPNTRIDQPGIHQRSATLAFDVDLKQVAIFEPQLQKLTVFDLASQPDRSISIAVPFTAQLHDLDFTRDGSGLILSFTDSTLVLVDIRSQFLLGPVASPTYLVVGDFPQGVVVLDENGKLNGEPGLVSIHTRASEADEDRLVSGCLSKLENTQILSQVIEANDEFKQHLEPQRLPPFVVADSEKWESLHRAPARFRALRQSSTAEQIFQDLQGSSAVLESEYSSDEYELHALQLTWQISRQLHDGAIDRLPRRDEFERLPPLIRVVFDNSITALKPNDTAAKAQAACDLGDLFAFVDERNDSDLADHCISALRTVFADPNFTDRERFFRHFNNDLRSRTDFQADWLPSRELVRQLEQLYKNASRGVSDADAPRLEQIAGTLEARGDQTNDLLYEEGILFQQIGNNDAAAKYWQELLEMKDLDSMSKPVVCAHLAQCLLQTNKEDMLNRAKELAEEACEMIPTYELAKIALTNSYLARINLMLAKNRFPEAQKIVDEACDRFPNDPRCIEAAARFMWTLNPRNNACFDSLDRAIGLAKAQKDESEMASFFQEKIRWLALNGNKEEVVQQLIQFANLKEQADRDTLWNVGEDCIRINRFEDAQLYLKTAEKASKTPEWLLEIEIAIVELRLGNEPEALKEFGNAVTHKSAVAYPDFAQKIQWDNSLKSQLLGGHLDLIRIRSQQAASEE